jgi:plastocyanin
MRSHLTTKRAPAAALALAALALLAACERGRPARTPTPLDLSTVGTISGDVRFAGTPPLPGTLDLSRNAECAQQHAGPVPAGDLIVHDIFIENVIVYIKEGLGDRVFAVPETPVVIDQQKCLFVPRIAAARAGQPIRFLNSDPLQHNVHGVSLHGNGWNFSLAVKGAARTITIDEPEIPIDIKCDIHPWMKASLGVFDHPYFAVTDAKGQYTLTDVPPGTYVIAAWQEKLGTTTKTVTLGPKEAKQLPISFGSFGVGGGS